MKKDQEVEFRALIREDIASFETKLLYLGAKKHGVTEIQDSYYCPINVNSFEEIAMDNVGTYSLRVRRKITDGIISSDLNLKVINRKGDHNAWEEEELKIDSVEALDKILKVIGFKVYLNLYKNRHKYTLEDINIFLEDISDFGNALEVEKIVENIEEKIEITKIQLKSFLLSLGFAETDILKKSITSEIMDKKAVF